LRWPSGPILGAIAGAAFGTLASAETPEVAFHGFVQAGFASRMNHADEADAPGDVLVAEPRLQLAVTGTVPGADMRLFAKADLFHDAVARKADWELREAYLDLGRRKLSARIGRQIITWGTGDLLFINDIFPKDWGALFAGRPLEYLKVGVDAAKVTLRVEPGALEAVVMPVFEPDRLPSRDRLMLFDPFPGARDHTTEYPRADLENIELAVRASGSLGGWDAAIYAYRGFYRSPAWIPDIPAAPTRVTERYPRRYVYGASIRGAALGGVVSLEGGYQESPEDRAGFDPFVENSQLLLLAGYQRQLSSSFTIGLQSGRCTMTSISGAFRRAPARETRSASSSPSGSRGSRGTRHGGCRRSPTTAPPMRTITSSPSSFTASPTAPGSPSEPISSAAGTTPPSSAS
jgi:hypothetical protein